jgi:hypothetical protein
MTRASVALALALSACAASRPPSEMSAPAPTSPAAGSADVHAQIDALDREITGELARAQLTPPPADTCAGERCAAALSEPFVTPPPVSPAAPAAQCHPAVSDKCNDSCTLATSICANQDKICELARQLPGDDWAANKCTGARASCKASHDSCCSCVL